MSDVENAGYKDYYSDLAEARERFNAIFDVWLEEGAKGVLGMGKIVYELHMKFPEKKAIEICRDLLEDSKAEGVIEPETLLKYYRYYRYWAGYYKWWDENYGNLVEDFQAPGNAPELLSLGGKLKWSFAVLIAQYSVPYEDLDGLYKLIKEERWSYRDLKRYLKDKYGKKRGRPILCEICGQVLDWKRKGNDWKYHAVCDACWDRIINREG